MSEERAVQGHLCWNEEVKPMINSKPIARRKLILPDQGFKLHSYLLAICKGKIRITDDEIRITDDDIKQN